MNYDSIIIELLSRVQKLELELSELKDNLGINDCNPEPETFTEEKRFSTKDIKEFVEGLKETAKANGEKTLTLISGDIHKLLKLRHCMPMVCNAMRQCMNEDDEVLHETPSGQSSTLEIKYELDEEEAAGETPEEAASVDEAPEEKEAE